MIETGLRLMLAIIAVTVLASPAAAADPAKVDAPARETISGELVVLAAASLTGPFQDIAKAFEAHHPGLSVRLSFAGSPTLVQQIEQGSPGDVFASADTANMRRLVDAKRVAATPRVFARNSLEIVVAKGNPKQISSLADLLKPGLVIVLGGPTVPVGRYALEAFAKANLKPPAASQELDVKAVLNKVALDEADAGIVYVTDVHAAGDRVTGITIPAEYNVTAEYPIATLAGAGNPGAARAFVDFVVMEPGQTVLRRFGFLQP